MPHELHPLRERVGVTSDGSTNVEVRTSAVEPGWRWIVTHYSVEDETTALSSIRPYVESGGYAYLLEEQVSPLAGVLYDGDKLNVLGEGDRFAARFNGSANNDLLRLFVYGWRLPPGVPLSLGVIAHLYGGGRDA